MRRIKRKTFVFSDVCHSVWPWRDWTEIWSGIYTPMKNLSWASVLLKYPSENSCLCTGAFQCCLGNEFLHVYIHLPGDVERWYVFRVENGSIFKILRWTKATGLHCRPPRVFKSNTASKFTYFPNSRVTRAISQTNKWVTNRGFIDEMQKKTSFHS